MINACSKANALLPTLFILDALQNLVAWHSAVVVLSHKFEPPPVLPLSKECKCSEAAEACSYTSALSKNFQLQPKSKYVWHLSQIFRQVIIVN